MKVPIFREMLLLLLTLAVWMTSSTITLAVESQRHPNVVVIVADDLGIGDLGCYGNDTINTPNIDRLASEGVQLTHHLAAATLCTPSRAALLTGRYAARYGLVGEDGTAPVIVHVASRASLPADEVTLGKALASVNYSTAAVGKWHLGAMCGLFGSECNGPKIHGFQNFYGIPFTLVEEIRGDHPFWIFPLDQPFYQGLFTTWLMGAITLIIMRLKLKVRMLTALMAVVWMTVILSIPWFVITHYRFHTNRWWKVSTWMDQFMNGILMENEVVVEQPMILDGLMQKLINYSVSFIEDHSNDDNPFFLYHSFGHVHTPMFTDPTMVGRSKHGKYGDNVEEMDVGVGTIMETLAANNLDHNTIVYFVSDHGGHLEAIDDSGERVGGHNGLFKGGKGQGASEGGIRVPGIYRWKGHIPSSVSIDTPTSLMDLMPTILDLANLPPIEQLFPGRLKKDLDGRSIAHLLQHGEPIGPRVFLHHCRQAIHALRWSKDEKHVYKMFLKRHVFPEGSYQCGWGMDNLCSCYGDAVLDFTNEPVLFNLIIDPYEDHPLDCNSSEYEEVVRYLRQYLADWTKSVLYPPSQFQTKLNAIQSLWLQPFCTKS